MNLDELLDRNWSKTYTCNEFVCEAWQKITQENLTQRLQQALCGQDIFKPLKKPKSPCLVFFSNNPKSSTHVGLFYCDKVLHLTIKGVQYVPLQWVAMNFKQVSFYE